MKVSVNVKPDGMMSLSEASKLTGYHQDYLGQLCRLKKVAAAKSGRNWYTTEEAIKVYFNSLNPGIPKLAIPEVPVQAIEPIVGEALVQNEAIDLSSENNFPKTLAVKETAALALNFANELSAEIALEKSVHKLRIKIAVMGLAVLVLGALHAGTSFMVNSDIVGNEAVVTETLNIDKNIYAAPRAQQDQFDNSGLSSKSIPSLTPTQESLQHVAGVTATTQNPQQQSQITPTQGSRLNPRVLSHTVLVQSQQQPIKEISEQYIDQLILFNLENIIAQGWLKGEKGDPGRPGDVYKSSGSGTTYNGTGVESITTTTLGVTGDATIDGTLAVNGGITGTINPTFTTGSIAFQGASGLTEDNSSLYFDDTKNALGLGTTTIADSAIVELSSTTKGFLPPRMTSLERDGIASPVSGLFIYNATTDTYNFYNGTAWTPIVSGSISSAWDDITDPSSNLALSMQGYSTTLTFGNATAATNLFNLTDTASNSGTGYLMNVATAAGSTLKPLNISVNGGTVALSIDASGNTIIGGSVAFGSTTTFQANDITDSEVSDTLTSSLFVGSGSTTGAVDLGTSEVAGTLAAGNGGTGISSYSAGDLLYASSGSAFAKLAIGSDGYCLTVSSGVPVWSACGAATADSASINGTPATDVNFINTTATGTIAAVTWSLNTTPSPDEISIAIGAASDTVAGIVTTGTQTFGGNKTFNGTVGFGNTTTFQNDDITDAEVSDTLTASNVVGSGSVTNATDLGTGEVAGTLGVANGGTGATTLTDLITLGTHTTGNYIAGITAGSGISGSASSEGATPTVALGALTVDWNQTGAFDIVLNNANSQIKILESVGATYYGALDVGDLSADSVFTLSGPTGTLLTSANYSSTLNLVYLQAANNLSDIVDASAARTNLGLGTIATQNSNSVTITGGSITGITDLAVADGGTGASTLTGIVIGSGSAALTGTTNSAGISGALSDETGTGSLVFATSPTLVTPVLGVASATSLSLAGAITGATSYNGLVVSANTGVITTGTWQGSALTDAYVSDTLTSSLFVGSGSTSGAVDLATAEVAGILAVGNGGTGASTTQGAINAISQLTTNGDLLYHNGTDSNRLARGANGECLTSNITTLVWGACGDSLAIGSSIASATQGSILFAGASGVLAQDNANFFWDDTNNRLGIGTAAPNNKFVVSGGASMGIIKVAGQAGNSSGGIAFGDSGTSNNFVGIWRGGANTTGEGNHLNVNSEGGYHIMAGPLGALFGQSTERFTILNIGFTGIDNINPARQLEVGTGSGFYNSTSSGLIRSSTSNGAGLFSRWDIGTDYNVTNYDFQISDVNAGTTPFTILKNSGFVGIGNAAPDTTLEVTGGLCVSDATGDDCTTTAGDIRADGAITANAFDVAERYASSNKIFPGTIVTVDSSKSMYVKEVNGSPNSLLGVVSTDPGFVLGWENNAVFKNAPHVVNVALAGRVPVKVTNENGAIIPGDFLTASRTFPGYAMRATESGETIGLALDAFNDNAANSSGLINMFVKISWQQINNTIALDAPTRISGGDQASLQGQSSTLGASNNSSTFIINQKASDDNAVADILQLQSGGVNRLMVSSTGSMYLNTSLDCIECNAITVSNNDSQLFAITATGNALLKGYLVIEDNNVAGSIVTDQNGTAEITFTSNMGTGKPVALLTPEGSDVAFVHVKEWKRDTDGNYTGFVIRAVGTDLQPVQSIVNYMVVGKPAGYVTTGIDTLQVVTPDAAPELGIGEVDSEPSESPPVVLEETAPPVASPGDTPVQQEVPISTAPPVQQKS